MGRVLGYGDWVGIPGEYYPATARARNPADTAERAPEALQGLEWVVSAGWARVLGTTLRARSVPLAPPCTQDPLACRLLANKGEISPYFSES